MRFYCAPYFRQVVRGTKLKCLSVNGLSASPLLCQPWPAAQGLPSQLPSFPPPGPGSLARSRRESWGAQGSPTAFPVTSQWLPDFPEDDLTWSPSSLLPHLLCFIHHVVHWIVRPVYSFIHCSLLWLYFMPWSHFLSQPLFTCHALYLRT